MDCTPNQIQLSDGQIEVGVGPGFSAFIGLSNQNSIWVGDICDNKIINKNLVKFGIGDCVIIPYGILHAGDQNLMGYPTFKVFSEVYTNISPNNQSQIWFHEGIGFSKLKRISNSTNNEIIDDKMIDENQNTKSKKLKITLNSLNYNL